MARLLERIKNKISGPWTTVSDSGRPTTQTASNGSHPALAQARERVLALWEPRPLMILCGALAVGIGVTTALTARPSAESPAASLPAAAAPRAVPTAPPGEAAAQAAARARPVEAWLKDLTDPTLEPKVRWAAAQALGRIGRGHDDVEGIVAGLTATLKDPRAHFMLRMDAAKALGKIGPEAEEAAPALLAATTDKASAVRAAAVEALALVKPAGAKR